MDTNEIKGCIKSFKETKVWVTKKSRIEAEVRVNKNNLISQIIVNYYTFLVLAFSIWSFIDKSEYISVLTIIASVGLFGISIFINSMNYREKACKYKDSYIRLSKLEDNLQTLIESSECEETLKIKLSELRKEYNYILELTDNHEEIDFINAKINSGDVNKDFINKSNWYRVKGVFIKLIIFLIPLAIVIFYFVRGKV